MLRSSSSGWCAPGTGFEAHAAARKLAAIAELARRNPKPEDEELTADELANALGESRTRAYGGYGTWRLRVPGGRPDLLVTLDPLTTQDCDHRYEARGHDPGVKLRHLSQVRHATCTSPICRRPAAQCDFEHNTPYEAGGRTCLCNGGPKCRHDHRLKQHPKWKVDQLPDGTFRWTTPAGRTYTTEPTRYPI